MVGMRDPVVVAVDVGTGSARAGVFDRAGRMLARAERPIAFSGSATSISFVRWVMSGSARERETREEA